MVLREGFRAVLSVPILIKGEAYGVLAVYWWEPHTPARSEIALLSALAGQAAIAIENARLYADAATHAAALDARYSAPHARPAHQHGLLVARRRRSARRHRQGGGGDHEISVRVRLRG